MWVLDEPIFPAVLRKRTAGERRIRIKMGMVGVDSLRDFDCFPDIFLGLRWDTNEEGGPRHNVCIVQQIKGPHDLFSAKVLLDELQNPIGSRFQTESQPVTLCPCYGRKEFGI